MYDDALKVVPEMSNLLLENEHVRVYDVRFKPGQKAAMHSHPNHVIYVLDDGKMKITPSKGKTQEINLKTGQVIWMDATTHAAENPGKTDIHNLINRAERVGTTKVGTALLIYFKCIC